MKQLLKILLITFSIISLHALNRLDVLKEALQENDLAFIQEALSEVHLTQAEKNELLKLYDKKLKQMQARTNFFSRSTIKEVGLNAACSIVAARCFGVFMARLDNHYVQYRNHNHSASDIMIGSSAWLASIYFMAKTIKSLGRPRAKRAYKEALLLRSTLYNHAAVGA